MTEPGPIPSKVVPEGRESRCSLTALLRPHGSPTACARGKIVKGEFKELFFLLFFLQQQHNKQKTKSRTTSKQNK